MKTLRLALVGASLAAATAAVVHARQAASPTNAARTEIVVGGTAARTNAAPTRGIRFQFDGIPYSDVVERFAQMAGKALLASTNLTGTLTYDDPNAYSYNEALDTLNQMLATKGVTLVEDGNNLRVVPFKELPAAPLRILRGTDNTGDARPGEVVTVVLDVANLDAKEVADSVVPMLSTGGSVLPLARGRGLVITDRLANIQRVRTLLATIGTAQSADRQMKTYTLVHASGAIVADLLNRTFGIATAPKRTQINPSSKALEVLPPDPNDYITAVYDDASRTLLLFGPPDRLALAEELVNKFEDKDGAGGDVRIYYPQSMKAEDLANLIRQAIPGVAAPNETAATAATKARVIPDAAQNRIIVAAPIPGQLEQIDQLVSRIDKGIQGTAPRPGDGAVVPNRSQSIQLTRIFRPRATDATNVASIVRQALTRRGKDGQAATTASVSFDAGSQSVVVTGTPGDLQTATDIVSQLETGTSQPTALQTKFIEVGSPDEARRLQPLVEQLYRNQTSDGTAGTVAHAKILADAESGRLIVTASKEHIARIEELVRQLRADQTQVKSRRLKVVTLRNTRADTALPGIQSLLNERLSDRRFSAVPKPSVVADAPNNRLLVTATDEQIKELEEVVAVVDIAPAATGRELAVIPLQAKSAAEMIPLVTQLAGQLGKPGQSAPSILPDPTGKQLIVLAEAGDLERIRSLVKQFDVSAATAAPRQFRGVDLFSRTAAEFVPLVTQLYQEQLRGQPDPAGGPATLIAETKANRIMVSGSDREIARVESIVRQLDPAGKSGAREETRVIRLRTASAADLVGLLEKSLNAQSQQVRVLVDARSNSLVVTGDHAAVDAAAKLVQQLDTRADAGPRELRILELKSGDASALAPMVNTLFAELLRDQRGADYVSPTRIVPDLSANRLIVTGAREEIEQVAGIVQRLDNAPQQAPGARVFKLNTADAAVLAPIVSQAMVRYDARGQAIKRVTVTPDDKSNSLIVSGTRSDLQDAESVIEKLDGDTGGGTAARERVLRIFDVKGDAETLAALVQKVFAAQNPGRNTNGLLSITPEPASHRLLVLAPPAVLAQVETAIASLDASPDQVARELHPVELKNSTATELLPKVTQIYAEQSQGRTQKPATLYPDAAGNRILVQGTADQAATVRQIVETLSSQPQPARETLAIDLGRLSEVQRVMPLVQQLYRDRVASNPQLGAADAQLVSDNKTGRLFVTARPDQLKVLESLVSQLRVAADASQTPRETRTFDVGSAADVARLLPIVQQLYTDRWKDRTDTDPADAQIVADAKGGRLIVSGKADHLKQIEAIISQLGAGKPRAQTRETRIIDLSTATAVELATTVRTLYTEEAKSRLGPETADTLITPDTGGNRLILVGDTNELAVVEGIVRKLDRTSAQSSSARVFKIKSADPDKVAEILGTSLVRYDAFGRAQKRATVSVDAKTRTLIVTGDPKELQGVSLIIEQLDQSLGDQPERHMKVITLRQGRAATLVRRVRQLYADRIKSQPDLGTSEVLMIEEPESNQMILAGNDAQLKVVGQIVEELQSAQVSRAARETRMIEVGTVDELTRIQPLVQQLYTDRWKGRDASDPADAQIIADPKNARFIVSGRTNQLSEIAAIIDQLRAQSAAGPRETRIFELSAATAAELSGTIRSLYQEQAKSRPGAPTTDTLILPDTGANRIIVTAATNEIAIVEDLIRKLDKVGSQSATARVFKIKSADPDKVAEILGSSLVRYDAFGRAQKRATVSVDAKTRTLIVTGDPKELQGVSLIIEQLDQSLGDQPERHMKVITLRQGRAATLVRRVRQLYADRIKSQPDLGTSEVLMIEEPESNQMILAGNDAQLKVVGQIVEELQSAQVSRAARETRMIEVGTVDELTRIQPLVQQLYTDRWKGRDASDPADAQIIADPKNARFIVSGRTNQLSEIAAIIDQLRAQSAAGPRETRIFELSAATAAELSGTIRSLYQEQAKSRPGAPTTDTLILPDTGANRIIVTAATNEVAIVEDLIRKLDKVGAQSSSARVFKIKSADPEKVAEILGSVLVRFDGLGRPQKRVSVVTDPKTRTLIATGDAKELQAAAVIIDQLDASLGELPGRTMRVLSLKDRRAGDLLPKLRRIYQDQARNDPEFGTTEPLILEDATSNQLILAGTERQLVALEEITVILQKSGDNNGRESKVFALERTSAASLVAMLSQVFSRQIASTEPTERLVASPGGNDRSLVVEAPRALLPRIEELVAGLDKPGPDGPNVVQTVRLTKSRAQDLADAVNRTLTNRTGPNLLRRVNVTAVAGANSLLISGTTNAVQDVMKIVRDLDQEGGGSGEIEVRVYKLENGTAKEVSAVLEQLLHAVTLSLANDASGRESRRVPEPSVSVDDRSNRLIISATAAHFRVIEKILPTLDKAPDRADRDVQFVWLRKAKAYEVASRLETLFEDRPRGDRPVIEADTGANSITIIARKGDLTQIQDLVSRLDQPAGNAAIQVRLRPLDRVAADQMAQMLRNIYPQVSGVPLRVEEKVPRPSPLSDAAQNPTNAAPAEVIVAVDKAANALLLSGPASELDQVDRLVSELSMNFYGNESEFRLFAIKDADPLVVARTLTELLRQDAAAAPAQPAPGQPPQPAPQAQPGSRQRITVVAEPRTRSVIVRARPTDFALMESLIQQLDKAGQTAQLEFRVVPLRHAQPFKVLPLVQQMVTQLAATRPGDPVSVALDARSRGLLVIGRDALVTQIEKMIQGLDKPSESVQAEVRIVPLKKANATQLAAVLQAMLRSSPQGEATSEARELQDQVRRLRIQGDHGEPVDLDLTRPIKIAADPAAGTGGGNRLLVTSSPENIRALVAVIELMDSVPVLEGVSIRFHRLEHADAAAVAQVLTTVFTQGRQFATSPAGPAGEPARDGRALVNPLAVSVDNRGNTLILSGQPDSIELAMRIARDMDRELEGAVTDVRLFRLKHASASRLVPLLQSVFTEGPAVPGTEGLSTQVTRIRTLKDAQKSRENQTARTRAALTIQADDQSNVLIVAARSDNLPLVADVIEQLDIPSASGLETVRVYPLEHADPSALQKVLTDLYTGPRSANIRAEDRPIITVDARTGALVVAGNGKAFAIIEGLLKSLDQKLPFELRDIALVALEHADANVVAPTLQKLMDARVTQRATLNQGQADALKVVIVADQRSNSLLVGGGREAFEMVQSLAKQLDAAGPALGGRVRLIPLQHADARVVAGTLGTLFAQRYAALHDAENARNKPVILADSRSNALLVAANQEDNRTLDDLLAKLDARQDNPALTLTVIPLRHNDSARVATVLEGVFAARLRAQALPGQTPLPSEQIKVETDALNNALVVSASKENLGLVQGLVEKLDQEPAVADGVFETFTLEFADAQRVATIIKSLVDQGLYRPGRLPGATAKTGTGRDILSTSVDRRSNTLIVSASPENLAIVREVVRRIDSKDFAATAEVRVYALQHARASSLATTLTQFFNAKRNADAIAVNANERTVPATVIPDDRVNTILVTGGKEAFALVERLLPQLDGDGVFTRLNFRVFPLRKATALKLQGTLIPIFANRPPRVRGEPVDPITIVADQWVNALLVGATVEDMGSVAALVERLDSEPSETGIAIHVFPLAKADARHVATTVQSLFRENLPNQILPISVSADERINAIVVSCGETDAKRIGELIRKLDTDQVAKVSEIRVFPLQYARAESLATILNTSLNSRPVAAAGDPSPNAQSVLQFITRTDHGQELVTAALKESILITPDSRMNSLIVSGPVDYMGLLEQIIGRLDSSSPQQAKIKVFALKNGDARQMADVLTQLFRMTPTTAAGGQRSVQYTLVRAATDGTSPEESLASATVGTAEQTALTVTIDPRTNSLLVGGTDHYVGLVSQIIDTLDSSVAHERNSEVVRLRNSQAPDVAAAIRQFLDQERQKMIQALGAESAQAAQRMFDQEVAVVAEQTSNTLLLSANRRYFDQIRAIIDELDQAQPQVLIQVLLAEVTLDNNTDLGIEWDYKGKSGNTSYGTGTDFGIADALSKAGGYSTKVAGSDFNFLLRAMKDQGRLEVLSRPQIVTADNKPATINIGQRVPLVDTSRLDAQNNLTTSFRYEDVGVNLTVTPKISADGFVKMEIGTTNSSISSSSVDINKSSSVPIINQRKANTTVSAQSGQTIIIGGLIGTTDDVRVKKMPVLGDIPYLGALFRSSTTTRERKELLILLTPQVLNNTQTPVPLQDPDRVLRDQVNSSPTFRNLMKGGELQRRLLEPIYPTNAPIRVVPGKGSL